MFIVNCKVYICTMYSVHCTLYSVQYTVIIDLKYVSMTINNCLTMYTIYDLVLLLL